jgi:hypothetical protein
VRSPGYFTPAAHSRQQQTIGHGPRVQEPGNGSHSCAANGPDPQRGRSTSLMRVIRGQASSGNQIREARPSRLPQNLSRRHLPDQPGMLMQPWNPALIKHRSSLHEPTRTRQRPSGFQDRLLEVPDLGSYPRRLAFGRGSGTIKLPAPRPQRRLGPRCSRRTLCRGGLGLRLRSRLCMG